MQPRAALGVLLLGLVSLCCALELGFPTVALCSPFEAPHYNCSYRRSSDDPAVPCNALYARLSTDTGAAAKFCSIFNTDGGAYATDSYGLMMLTRLRGAAESAVLFYTLPDGVSTEEAQPTTLAPVVSLDPILDLIPLVANQTNLLRILGRESGHYSVLSAARGAGSDVLVAIDAVYFTYWQEVMRSFYRDLFLDPSTWLLCLTALLIIWYGALRSTSSLLGSPEGGHDSSLSEQPETIRLRMVLILPISGSLVLLAMFFFLDLMWPLLFIFCAFAGFVSVSFVVWPLAELIPSHLRFPANLTCLAPRIDEIPTAVFIAAPFSAIIILAWWLTDLWLFTDIIALCIGIVSLSHLRLPDLRVGTILLCVFFLYDIFWVFISPYFFSGRSVMISVAVNIRSLPMVLIVPHIFLDSPGLLGLGDIILPGLVLAYLFRYDRQHTPLDSHWSGYFRTGMIGYIAGFVVTVLALVVSDGHGQPALLYLVPGVLVPTIIRAYKCEQFSSIWSSPAPIATNDHELTTLSPETPIYDGQALLAQEEDGRKEGGNDNV